MVTSTSTETMKSRGLEISIRELLIHRALPWHHSQLLCIIQLLDVTDEQTG
nr:MAG TPA: hypothetical protein [Caudoviricetes sp.]